jgi:hypothetical protein
VAEWKTKLLMYMGEAKEAWGTRANAYHICDGIEARETAENKSNVFWKGKERKERTIIEKGKKENRTGKGKGKGKCKTNMHQCKVIDITFFFSPYVAFFSLLSFLLFFYFIFVFGLFFFPFRY